MQKREIWIDCIKGLMIILVVLGHACIPSLCNQSIVVSIIYTFINSFNMPIFFVLSGYLFWNSSSKKNSGFISKKVKRLILPYVIYIVYCYIIIFILSNINFTKNYIVDAGYNIELSIPNIFIDILLCKGTLDKHIWFIYVLFIIFSISYFLEKRGIKQTYILYGSSLITLLFIISGIDENTIIFKITYYFIFFSYSTFMIEKRFKRNQLLLLCIMFCALCIVYIVFADYLREIRLLIILFKIILGILSSIVLINIFRKQDVKKMNLLSEIGRNSFSIYLIHQPFFTSGSAIFLMKIFNNTFVSITLATMIGIFVPLSLDKILFYIKEKKNDSKFFI